jgi:hypothetical protein
MRDPYSYPDQCGDDVSLTEEQKILARRVICSYATDAADATELMMACGIHPSQIDPGYLTRPPGIQQRMCT